MEWINYHHLLYFWVVAREGSIARACEELTLTQPTISGQLRALEDSFGDKLFTRSGRSLKLTEFGNLVYRYAEDIFTLGRELNDVVKGRPVGRLMRFVVGVADVVPKLVAYRLLRPALNLSTPVHIVCREDKSDRLLGELAMNGLDLVISDAPVGPAVKVRAFNHVLGECGISFMAAGELAATYRRSFPKSLNGAPVLLPTANTMLRRLLDQWFDSQGIRPTIAGEFEDSALLKVFGQNGCGIFPVPTVVEAEAGLQYKARVVGRTDVVRETFYAISVERKIKHPAVVAITEAARENIFTDLDRSSSQHARAQGNERRNRRRE